jgi:class 3 adenylate cyclase/tetratricopeptide (TPR) repeat protein
VICSSCGTENRPDAKFCMECGNAFASGCPSCGTVNPPGAKFCSECATPLAGAAAPPLSGATPAQPAAAGPASRAATPAAAERRLVSVLFADLVGFTPFAEEKDAEDVREVLTRYFDLARDIIGRYGGTVEKFIGDAVMAVWGAPIAREDDAERAVRAALELVDAVPALGPGIMARGGVLTGEAAVTIGATNQGMVAGDLVNTAARLQSAAAPGMVLVGEPTQRAAAGAIAFEPAGDQVLKGKSAPVPAWRAVRVVAQRGGRNRSESLEAPFVGRDEELRQLKDLFHATSREGRARLVSVIGPGGIGKTRLSWELLKYIDGLLDRVWWHAGRSPAYGDGITFWALGEMVRGRSGLAETDDEPTTRARIASTVREHVPDEAEAQWIESALLALVGLESGVPSAQLFAAWRTFFERLATSAPVVMVFEDFHHADKGLLDFIDHLMEWSRGVPITVVTLARPELLEKRPDWGAGKRSFTSIYLEPLPREAMEQLLGGLVPGLPRKAIDAIVARADGIPLYAVETVRMLLAQGRIVLDRGEYRPVGDLDDLAVPETLTALIAARLDGLPAEDRAIVEDAAVLGQSFTVEGLAAVSGVDPDLLERPLASLVRRELLVLDVDPRSPERGQYAFVQSLIREVAYNTLAKKDRKARHLAAARYFESLETDELAGGLAGHYLAAHQLAGDATEAAALAAQARLTLRAAAERAAALGSHDQALAFLQQALDVSSEPEARAEFHTRALVSARQRMDEEAGLRHAEGAVQERRRTPDRPAIAIAIADYAEMVGRAGDPDRARTILLDAWGEFSDLEQTPAGVALMVALVHAYRGLNDSAAALTWVARVAPIAERLRLREATAATILSRGSSFIPTGMPREGLILVRGAHQLALIEGLPEVELRGRVLLTFFEQWGDPAAGVTLAKEGLEIGRRTGSRVYGSLMVGNATIAAFRVGEWDWAASLLDEWVAVDSAASHTAEFHIDRAILRAMRGEDPSSDIEAARAIRVDGGVTDPQWESYELWARAWAAFGIGDMAASAAHALRATDVTGYFAPLALPLGARAALWANDLERALGIAGRLDASGFVGAALDADVGALRAGIAALEGRGTDALAGYREAIRSYRELGLAFDEAAVVVDMATLLPMPERQAPEVLTVGARARETLTRLGATPYLDRLDLTSAHDPGSAGRPVPMPDRVRAER